MPVLVNLEIAAAIDAADLPDVVGSLAGNDTIMVVASNEASGREFEHLVNKLRSAR